jgi:hypothetical protein
MTAALWTLILVQIAMGGFDTVYHHELTQRLAWRPARRLGGAHHRYSCHRGHRHARGFR